MTPLLPATAGSAPVTRLKARVITGTASGTLACTVLIADQHSKALMPAELQSPALLRLAPSGPAAASAPTWRQRCSR